MTKVLEVPSGFHSSLGPLSLSRGGGSITLMDGSLCPPTFHSGAVVLVQLEACLIPAGEGVSSWMARFKFSTESSGSGVAYEVRPRGLL